MPAKRHSEEQILYALRQVEGGKKVSEVCREMGVSQQAVYSWKRRYAGLGLNELRELRQLREENRKLKGIVAVLTLDKHSLSLREIELEEFRQPGFSLNVSAYASKQIARPHSPTVVLKARTRSLPTKILDGLKYGHIQSQGRKSAKQQGLAPRIVKRFGQ
jgi:putative transposase